MCLDRDGRARWCAYLSPGCCGGLPFALPDGRYVASSGCGGVLSWLDADGNILLQSQPSEGVGLASAFSHEVRVLPDGRVLVGGGPGVVAFGPTSERGWADADLAADAMYDDPADLARHLDRSLLAG